MGESLVAKLQNVAWGAHLQDLLRYHILNIDLPLFDLVESQNVITANGKDVVITRLQGTSRVRVNGISVLATYVATNGFAYMLDGVLQPAWLDHSLLDVVSVSFSTLASLVVVLEYESIFSDPTESLTIFAPNNEAFQQLDPLVLAYLQSDIGVGMLEATMLYHMVPDGPFPFPFRTLTTAPLFTLLDSAKIDLFDDGTVRGNINQANIVNADIVANNGLIHEIDNVLLVETIPIDQPTDAPAPTPFPTSGPVTTPTAHPEPTTMPPTSAPTVIANCNPNLPGSIPAFPTFWMCSWLAQINLIFCWNQCQQGKPANVHCPTTCRSCVT